MLQKLLFKPDVQPILKGRLVRFGNEEPDIQLVTGPMEDCILIYLQRNSCPVTAKEITAGLGCKGASRVTRTLQLLVKQKKLQIIKIDGCVTEYELAL